MKEKIDVLALHQFYRGLSELVGVEDMFKIYQAYKGMQITIPTHLYDRKLAAQKVVQAYNGHNQQILARNMVILKSGFNERYVRIKNNTRSVYYEILSKLWSSIRSER